MQMIEPAALSHAVVPVDAKVTSAFIEKSVSENTRTAYRSALIEFFRHAGMKPPQQIAPADVVAYRDHLIRLKRKASTVNFKLSVVRSFFDYLRGVGLLTLNPASTRLVSPPALPEHLTGRILTGKEVGLLLSGPDRRTTGGARDHALLLVCLRMSLRVSEVCSLRTSSIHWSHGRWIMRVKVKGGRERTLPLPPEVKRAIDDYVRLDAGRRRNQHCDGPDSYIFQPLCNYRTLEFDRALTRRQVRNIVARWGDYCGLGRLTPHDLRRTAITQALDQGLSYRQVQMMSGHADPKTVMRYDHHRDNLDQNAINFLSYGDGKNE